RSKSRQVRQERSAPLRRCTCPRYCKARSDGITTFPRTERIFPAQSLHSYIRFFGVWTHVVGGAGPMRLTKGMPTCYQRYRFFISHTHSAEGIFNILSCQKRVRIAIGAFRIDVYQAHLHSCEGIFQIAGMHFSVSVIVRNYHALACNTFCASFVALVSSQPCSFGAPIHLFRFPDISTTATESYSF